MDKNILLKYAEDIVKTFMKRYKAEELPPANKFHYHQGVFLNGVERLYTITGNTEYYDYVKAYCDNYIDSDGNCPLCRLDQFDDMQPAALLFLLYKKTGDKRYKLFMDTIADAIEKFPKNALGGVWHKLNLKNQMWLDSMYMMGIFTAIYGKRFGVDYFEDVVYRQAELMFENMRSEETGLLYHAWDDSKQADWANPVTGCSQSHWGRALGWYVSALSELCGIWGAKSPHYNKIVFMLNSVIKAIAKYQDEETGLWYQVVDKTDSKGNWLETSCSALFVYAMAKGVNEGVLGAEYIENIEKGCMGVISRLQNDGDDVLINGVCRGTGVGSEEFYFKRPVVVNDLHGAGAVLYMLLETFSL